MHPAAMDARYCLVIVFIPALNTVNVSGPCHCYNVGAEFYMFIDPLLKSTHN